MAAVLISQRSPRYGHRDLGLIRCRGVHRQAGVAGGASAIQPCQLEIIWGEAPDRGRVASMESQYRCPARNGRIEIIDIKRIVPLPADQEVGAALSVQYVIPADRTDVDPIISIASVGSLSELSLLG
jgi:hypothetical protein